MILLRTTGGPVETVESYVDTDSPGYESALPFSSLPKGMLKRLFLSQFDFFAPTPGSTWRPRMHTPRAGASIRDVAAGRSVADSLRGFDWRGDEIDFN